MRGFSRAAVAGGSCAHASPVAGGTRAGARRGSSDGNFFSFFFRAHRTNDLTKKFEKVGPFECDELEKHCRVSAKCYPKKVPVLYTMAKEKLISSNF